MNLPQTLVLPKSGPSMHGLKRRYRPGMKLKVECISRHSLPAANLSFFINNDAFMVVYHRIGELGLISTRSSFEHLFHKANDL
ncbi:hypothetical protein HF086_017650 [Spodoptera exigua]|uniref:Uncharacterized protein n=1 Tax=Spodoptera exigua TaxID=7107 RepID=A0A922SF39_SPOEX|nr:hypothetical protein HF086_017650 [Spodoptera exigua]